MIYIQPFFNRNRKVIDVSDVTWKDFLKFFFSALFVGALFVGAWYLSGIISDYLTKL